MVTATTREYTPDFRVAEVLRQQRQIAVTECYQCAKCSAGCPLTFAMDFLPHEIIRLTGLGQEEAILGSQTIWVCSSCETCTTRCPNDIDIAGVMDYWREVAARRQIAVPQPQVLAFHRAFLAELRLGGGRLHEGLLLLLYYLRSGQGLAKLKDRSFIEDLKLGLKMYRKGRLSLKPPARCREAAEIKAIFRQAR